MARVHLPLLVAAFVALAVVASAGAAADVEDVWDPTMECDDAFPLTVTDATGETVELEEPPEDVVALQASDARNLYHIGAEDRVVGFPVEFATADLEVGDRVDISEDFETDIEAVVDLEPDLVIAASVSWDEDIEHLRGAGLTVYHFETESSLEDVAAQVLRTGELVGECEGAVESVEWMDERITDIAAEVADEPTPLTYYGGDTWWTPGEDTPQNDMMTVANLENLAVTVGITGWEQISEEDIVAEDPDAIVYNTPEPPETTAIEGTSAFEHDAIVSVDSSDASQPTPHVVYAIEEMAAVHEYTEIDEEAEADDADSIPGLGAVPALVALIGVALLARRR